MSYPCAWNKLHSLACTSRPSALSPAQQRPVHTRSGLPRPQGDSFRFSPKYTVSSFCLPIRLPCRMQIPTWQSWQALPMVGNPFPLPVGCYCRPVPGDGKCLASLCSPRQHSLHQTHPPPAQRQLSGQPPAPEIRCRPGWVPPVFGWVRWVCPSLEWHMQ